MKKRFISIICIVAVLFAFFAASCSTKDNDSKNTDTQATGQEKTTSTNENTGDTKNTEKGYTLPIVTEPTTLRYGTIENYYSPKSYTLNLPSWQEIEKKTGVKIEWDVTPSAQYATVMSTRLAAGTDLPDIIMVPGDPMTYIPSGIFAPLSDMIDQYAPNIKKMLDEDKRLRKIFTAPDGKIYTLSVPTSAQDTIQPYGYLVREDWMKKLSINEPTTINEWYDMLKAFKEKDPNGNNEKDETPFTCQNVSALLRFGNSWGLSLAAGGFHEDNDGKVQFGYMLPEAKELLTWLNKLFQEGLIDPDFPAMNTDQFHTRVTSNQAGATINFLNQIDSYTKPMVSKVPDAKWTMVVPPKGPIGHAHMERYGPISRYYAVMSNSKKQELAVKWLDYTYGSDEGNTYQTFGVEGLTYNVVDGKKVFTDYVLKNPDGLGAIDVIRSVGAWPGTLYRQTEDYFLAFNGSEFQSLAQKVLPYQIDKIPAMLSTEDETQVMKEVWTDINTYVNEMALKYILGQESLDKYDQFVETLKSMGIDEVIKVKQAQLDRYNKN